MGDCLQAGKLSHYVTQANSLGELKALPRSPAGGEGACRTPPALSAFGLDFRLLGLNWPSMKNIGHTLDKSN